MPRSVLPELPEALNYDTREYQDVEAVFVSALLYRQERFRFRFLPIARVSHPQLHLQLCVLDGEGNPAVYVPCVLVPGWIAPGARWIGGRPAQVAELVYPGGAEAAISGGRWEVSGQGRLAVEAAAGSPIVGVGPVLGKWERTVSYFCQRNVAYIPGPRGLRRVELEDRRTDVTPVEAQVTEAGLLSRLFSITGEHEWPALHSAWLCPPISTSFVTGKVETPIGSQIPAPG